MKICFENLFFSVKKKKEEIAMARNNIKKTRRVFAGVGASTANTGQEQPTDRFGIIFQWGMRIITSIIILSLAYLLGLRMTAIIVDQIERRKTNEHKRLLVHQLSRIAFYVVMLAGIFFALVNMGVQTTSLVTIMGTMMVTIGLALQSTLGNIFSGVGVILADNFRIGDMIRIYLPWVTDPIVGRVEDLNVAFVMLRQEKTNKIIYIPNSSVSSNVVVNLSRSQVEE